MRVLLDECVPQKLRRELPGHEVKTVVDMGWAGIKNGDLLKRAADNFDFFLTVDQNLKDQQNVLLLPIPVIVIMANSNDVNVLRPLMPKVRDLLVTIQAPAIHLVNAGNKQT